MMKILSMLWLLFTGSILRNNGGFTCFSVPRKSSSMKLQ